MATRQMLCEITSGYLELLFLDSHGAFDMLNPIPANEQDVPPRCAITLNRPPRCFRANCGFGVRASAELRGSKFLAIIWVINSIFQRKIGRASCRERV